MYSPSPARHSPDMAFITNPCFATEAPHSASGGEQAAGPRSSYQPSSGGCTSSSARRQLQLRPEQCLSPPQNAIVRNALVPVSHPISVSSCTSWLPSRVLSLEQRTDSGAVCDDSCSQPSHHATRIPSARQDNGQVAEQPLSQAATAAAPSSAHAASDDEQEAAQASAHLEEACLESSGAVWKTAEDTAESGSVLSFGTAASHLYGFNNSQGNSLCSSMMPSPRGAARGWGGAMQAGDLAPEELLQPGWANTCNDVQRLKSAVEVLQQMVLCSAELQVRGQWGMGWGTAGERRVGNGMPWGTAVEG